MHKLEQNQKNLDLCIRQLNALKDIGARITSESHNADFAEFLSVKERTTNHLLSYFINGNEIRERVKELEKTKLDIEVQKSWYHQLGIFTLYYCFPPTALYFALKGYREDTDAIQQVYSIMGQVESLLFVIKDKLT